MKTKVAKERQKREYPKLHEKSVQGLKRKNSLSPEERLQELKKRYFVLSKAVHVEKIDLRFRSRYKLASFAPSLLYADLCLTRGEKYLGEICWFERMIKYAEIALRNYRPKKEAKKKKTEEDDHEILKYHAQWVKENLQRVNKKNKLPFQERLHALKWRFFSIKKAWPRWGEEKWTGDYVDIQMAKYTVSISDAAVELLEAERCLKSGEKCTVDLGMAEWMIENIEHFFEEYEYYFKEIC